MNKQIKRAGFALAVATLLALAGCGTSTLSKSMTDDGRATEIVFPSIENDAWQKGGTFPQLDTLRRIGPGVTKDQLYNLVGRPHFREGLLRVREWDYIFNFRIGGGVTTCQYKVIFDTEMRAQSFHWMPANCSDLLKVVEPQAPGVERAVESKLPAAPRMPVAPMQRRVELSADALFAFGRAGAGDLQVQGRRELDALALNLREVRQLDRLKITGYTDRLGSPAYNERLSLARATTVRDYLVRAGVPAQAMQVAGSGMAEPKVQCAQKNRQALIDCLAPNRRVAIEITGER